MVALRTVAIVQARIYSSRYPGKILADVNGRPMVEQICRRLDKAKLLDDVIIATPDIELRAILPHRLLYIGEPTDVLRRYVRAAETFRADRVVRVTGDCPLIDPEVVDRVITAHTLAQEYTSNVNERSFPYGLDTEVLWTDVLHRMNRMAGETQHREHVTLYLRENPHLFATSEVVDAVDNTSYDWRVDWPADLEKIRAAYKWMGDRVVGYRDLIEWWGRQYGEPEYVGTPSATRSSPGSDGADHGAVPPQTAVDGQDAWYERQSTASDDIDNSAAARKLWLKSGMPESSTSLPLKYRKGRGWHDGAHVHVRMSAPRDV